MIVLRSFLYLLLLVLSIILVGIPLAIVGWVLPNSLIQEIGYYWASANLWAQRTVCGLAYQVEGSHNIPQDRPVIIMSKHQSAWETIALRGLFKAHQAWVLKRELMWLPIFGWALAATRPIAIDRAAGYKAARQIVNQGMRRLAEGMSIVIFPEGTRVKPGTRGKYGIGGGMLARRSQIPVVPVAHNAGVFWKRRALRKLPGTVQVVVGSPLITKDKTAVAIMKEVEQWIEAQQEKLPLTP